MSQFVSTFFIVPARILNLPDLTLANLKFYETIFQFWNHGKQCFLSNDEIKERTGIKSDSTISDCFTYFEQHNEMKRVTKGKSRYIVQPTLKIEHVENTNQGLAVPRPTSRQSETQGLATARHNINNINNKEIKRERAKNQRAPLSPFQPDQKNILLCQRLGLNLDEELKSFANRHKGEKNQYEFERWIKASKDYSDKKYANGSKPNQETKSTVPEYGPGHPTWEFRQELKRQKSATMN